MQVVLDTNVLVSSLLKNNSKPSQIINAVLEGKIQLVIDERVSQEYREVLHRPKLNIPIEKADAILNFIANSAIWIHCNSNNLVKAEIDDHADLPFAEVAIASSKILVTGNLKHFRFLNKYSVQVLLPDEFLKKYPHIF